MTNKTMPSYIFYLMIMSLIVLSFVSVFLAVRMKNDNNLSKIQYLTYKEVSTSIDERGRLNILDFKNNLITIYSDSIAYGIHSQVSNIILKDYKEKNNVN